MRSRPPLLPPLPLLPDDEFDVSDNLLISSNPINSFFNSFADDVALSRLSDVSSAPSPIPSKISEYPVPESPITADISIPSIFPHHSNNLRMAIANPLTYGSTFATVGNNILPIVLDVAFILLLSNLNWFDGEFIVFAKSPQATFDWSKIARTLNCIFSPCVISDTVWLTPYLYAYVANVALVISIPYLYNALDCPMRPLCKLFITVDF